MSYITEQKIKEQRNEVVMQSGWAGPGIEVWPEEDDYAMWRDMKKNERRHLACNISALASSPFCGKGYHNG
ncbi:MAG: hypothetical protein P8X67_07600 [Syntrophobacterales bacterium]|jgi:hypothetical protein